MCEGSELAPDPFCAGRFVCPDFTCQGVVDRVRGYRLPPGVRIVHTPEIGLASVQGPGLIVPEILFRADGPDALGQVERWASERCPAGR